MIISSSSSSYNYEYNIIIIISVYYFHSALLYCVLLVVKISCHLMIIVLYVSGYAVLDEMDQLP